MIGNYEDALDALETFNSGDTYGILSTDGTDRIVFLINNVVYKVEYGGGSYNSNQNEYNNYLSIRDYVSDPIRVPETSLFDIDGVKVIAMEYIKGEAMAACYCVKGEEHYRCLPDDILSKVEPFIGDTGGMNVIYNGEAYYIVDMAD